MSDNIKNQVREFYDQVGWRQEGDGSYQNARYEDLRPVARDYIHRCHLRVNRHLKPRGRFLLDAGSGPVQYPEYLTYSKGYTRRVCLDISVIALQEARKKIGSHGLFVVGDVANLPFCSDCFEGIVSLHTLHHLPLEEQRKAYNDLLRTLSPGSSMVIVNGWTDSPLMRWFQPFIRLAERMKGRLQRRPDEIVLERRPEPARSEPAKPEPTGTFIQKLDATWLHDQLKGRMDYQVLVWRSVSVHFLRALIHPKLFGRFKLRALYWLEERFPRWFGENGQYPLVVVRKPATPADLK